MDYLIIVVPITLFLSMMYLVNRSCNSCLSFRKTEAWIKRDRYGRIEHYRLCEKCAAEKELEK